MQTEQTAALLPCPFCGDDGEKGRQTVTQFRVNEENPIDYRTDANGHCRWNMAHPKATENVRFDRIICRCCGGMAPELNWQARAALATKPAGAGGAVTDLHAAIMNLPCTPPDDANINQRLSYKSGHRDARHAAAELVVTSRPPAQAADSTEPVAWKDVTPWMRDFLGKGEGYVRTLYNEPHDAISRTDVGAWIQVASDMLRRIPIAAEAAPPASSSPAGFVMVPLKPTKAMQDAWDGAPGFDDCDKEFANAYRLMVEAATNAAEPAGGEAPNCREPDGRCGLCGGDWSVCGCDGMLKRRAALAASAPGAELGKDQQ